jgi:hypothetical protein
MSGNDSNPFGGKNTASSVLVTLIVSSFVVCMLYIIYRQLSRLLEEHNAAIRRRDALAPAVDLDQKPVLWDVYIERGELEWEWNRSKVSKPSLMPSCAPWLWPPSPSLQPSHLVSS